MKDFLSKHKKAAIYIIAAVMILGGIMGLIKNNIPVLSNFDFRHILTGTLFSKPQTYPIYIRIYGTIMALLEISTFPIFIKATKTKVYYIISVLSLNAAVCLITIFLGDLIAAVSLVVRAAAIAILVYSLKAGTADN